MWTTIQFSSPPPLLGEPNSLDACQLFDPRLYLEVGHQTKRKLARMQETKKTNVNKNNITHVQILLSKKFHCTKPHHNQNSHDFPRSSVVFRCFKCILKKVHSLKAA